MDRTIPETPAPEAATPRWQLTAPESYVLLNGPRASGVEAFKKGLLELVARGVLEIEWRTKPRSFRRTVCLVPGPKSSCAQLAPPPLQSIWRVYTLSSPHPPRGTRVRDLAWCAREYDTPIKDYARRVIVPALVERGFYRREDYRRLGLFAATRYVETSSGAAAKAELEALMARVDRDFDVSAGRDPRQSLALVGALGAAIVLMNPRFADLRQLGAALGTGRTAESARIGLELDLSDFNLESLDVDTSALDGLGGMFEAFGDIGDIGDSGGGDGGGGDGDSGGGE